MRGEASRPPPGPHPPPGRGRGSAQDCKVNGGRVHWLRGRARPQSLLSPSAALQDPWIPEVVPREGMTAFLGGGPAAGGKTEEDLGLGTWLGLLETGCRWGQKGGHSCAGNALCIPGWQASPWGPRVAQGTEAQSRRAVEDPERPGKATLSVSLPRPAEASLQAQRGGRLGAAPGVGMRRAGRQPQALQTLWGPIPSPAQRQAEVGGHRPPSPTPQPSPALPASSPPASITTASTPVQHHPTLKLP